MSEFSKNAIEAVLLLEVLQNNNRAILKMRTKAEKRVLPLYTLKELFFVIKLALENARIKVKLARLMNKLSSTVLFV